MIIAKWSESVGVYLTADPQRVAEEILSIGESVTPKQIVNLARKESTELHKLFEWDDTKAAERYREYQAGAIVRKLVIQEKSIPTNRPEIRLFYHSSKQKGYVPVEFVIRHEDEYAALLEQAWRDLRAFKQKYCCLKELEEILELIH